MNNFTKSSARAYWHSITNLPCCSPGFRKLQKSSMKAMMFFMLFAMSTGAMFAQLDSQGGDGEVYTDIDACTNAIPEMTSTEDMMEAKYNNDIFKKCSESSEDFIIHFVEEDGYGEWGVSTGFTEGSDNCNWTYYYVYIIKCDGAQTAYTIQYSGGDRTPPQIQKGMELEPAKTEGINACFDDRPLAPYGASTLASYFEDSCGHTKTGTFGNPLNIGLRTKTRQGDCDWTVIYVYTISDECSETADVELTFTYSGSDQTAPEFETHPQDIKVECGNVPEALGLDWTDNCGGSGTSAIPVDTGDDFFQCEGGVITRTWTITDECGNENSHVQKITVNAAEPIAFIPVDDIFVPCADRDNIDSYIPQAHYTNEPQGSRTATLGCVIDGNVDGTYDVPDTSCGNFKVSYKFEDACGNIIEETATVYIVDDINPSIDVAAMDTTVECGIETKEGFDNEEAFVDWLNNNGYAEARDNCDDDLDWSNDYSVNNWSDGCGDTGSVTVVFTVLDDCENMSKTVATFHIVDTTPPAITDPKPLVAVCDGAGNFAQYEAWVDNHGTATATDECDDDLTWSHDGPMDEAELLAALAVDQNGCSEFTGYVDVTFTVTDDCGLDAYRTERFSIVDSIAPTITVEASDDTVECDANTNNPTNDADYQAWLLNNGGAEAEDGCSPVTWSNNDPSPTGDACAWVYTVTFTATDDCGNYSTTTASFTIEDTLSPAIADHAEDLTVECGNDTDQAFADWLSNHGQAAAIDLCDDELDWTNDWNKRPFSDDCGETGSITVLFTVTDDCGNSSSTKAVFTIEDTTDPYFRRFPRNITLYKDADCEVDTTTYNTGAPSGRDRCSDTDVEYEDSRVTGDCGNYVITRTWTVTDDCGNDYSEDQIITVEDNTAPELTGVLPLGESDIDLCEAIDGPTVEDIRVLFEDNCTAQEDLVITRTRTDIDDDNDCTWMVVYTYNVEDLCGNAYPEFKIIYSGGDFSAPTLIEGAVVPVGTDDNNSCAADAPEGPTEQEILDLYEDNCTDLDLDNIEKVTTVEYWKSWGRRWVSDPNGYSVNSCKWRVTYSYYIEDDCDNEVWLEGHDHGPAVKIYYYGEDTLAPVLVGVPPAVTSNIDACADDDLHSIIENGPGVPSDNDIRNLYLECGDVLGEGVYVQVQNNHYPVIEGNDCYWVATYTWRVYDDCDNETFLKVQYTGGDRTDPSLLRGSPTTKYGEYDVCIDDASDAIENDIEDISSIKSYYFDNCDDDLTVSLSEAGATGTDCNWEIIVTYTIEDDCGNRTTLEVAYNGGDNTAPVQDGYINDEFGIGNAPEYNVCFDISMETVLSAGYILEDKVVALLYEDCSGITVTHEIYYERGQQDDCYWDIHVKYTIVDACDNETYFTVHHYGGDNTAPTADPLDDIEVKCIIEEVPEPDTSLVNASDNCDDYVDVTFEDDTNDGQNPATITRRYRLTDDCGNYSFVSQLILISVCPDVVVTAPQDQRTFEDEKQLDFKAYPVPFNRDVTLNYNFDFDTDIRVEVYDTRGLLVLTKEVKGYRKGSNVELPLNLANGSDQMYYVKLITNQGTVTKKIVSSSVNKR